jgi:hypothetical protein
LERYINLIAVLFCICPVCCIAQTDDFFGKDSVLISEKFLTQTDTVHIDSLISETIPLTPEKFKPNSKKATLYSAFFPGLGQIYNKKYWKLPLVYGSFIGCAYAINWNGSQYNGYRKAYIDFIDEDPATNSWEAYRYGIYKREDFENWTADMKRSFPDALKSARDFHRRNRDLSYIVTVGVYAIWIVDTYVDAQLFDFDISPDLSVRIEPILFDRMLGQTRTFGMQFSFAF